MESLKADLKTDDAEIDIAICSNALLFDLALNISLPFNTMSLEEIVANSYDKPCVSAVPIIWFEPFKPNAELMFFQKFVKQGCISSPPVDVFFENNRKTQTECACSDY